MITSTVFRVISPIKPVGKIVPKGNYRLAPGIAFIDTNQQRWLVCIISVDIASDYNIINITLKPYN